MDTANRTFNGYEFKLRPDWPVDIGMASGGLLGYVLAWIGLICILNLQHWMAGTIGALAGGLAGWAWYRFRPGKWNRS